MMPLDQKIIKIAALEYQIDEADKIIEAARKEIKPQILSKVPADGTQEYIACEVTAQIIRSTPKDGPATEVINDDFKLAVAEGKFTLSQLQDLIADGVIGVLNYDAAAHRLASVLEEPAQRYTATTIGNTERMVLKGTKGIAGGKAKASSRIWKGQPLAKQIDTLLEAKLHGNTIRAIERGQVRVR